MADNRRVLQVGQSIGEPAGIMPKRAVAKKPSEFPGVARAHVDVAQKLTSPFLNGPPLCDELMSFVQHVFTEEEASVARHLGKFRGRSVEAIARAEHRPADEIAPILTRLSEEKRVISSSGRNGQEKYTMMAILPGIFESALISQSPDSMSPWHRRLAELVEVLYQTGYYADYVAGNKLAGPFVRVLPVGQSIETHPMALPSDRLEVILDRFETFAVGQCQCRMTQQVHGRDCGKPIHVCTLMGQWAKRGIQRGWFTEVPRAEVLAIKRDAEEHGLVTWLLNLESTKGQASCSCCPCCCYALRLMNDFNAPGLMAPAHFLPRFDDAKCTHCAKCAVKCPTQALSIDPVKKTRVYRRERCVGCGLCAVACDRQKAIVMEPVPDYSLPYRSWFSMIASAAPIIAKQAWRVWRSR